MATNGTILGLDPARKTGWCVWEDGRPVDGGVWVFGKPGQMHAGMRLSLLKMELNRILAHDEFTLLAAEAPYSGGPNRKVPLVMSEYTGVLKCWCMEHNVRFANFPPPNIKQFATGKRTSPKKTMVEFAKNEWRDMDWPLDPGDHEHQADAMYVAAYAASQEPADG